LDAPFQKLPLTACKHLVKHFFQKSICSLMVWAPFEQATFQ